MPLLHLDSNYYYAPYPRVYRLEVTLSRLVSMENIRLLYMPFSSPQQLVKMLNQMILGQGLTSVTMMQTVIRVPEDNALIRFLKKKLWSLLTGKRRKICIGLDDAIRVIGDERLALVDFILFTKRYRNEVVEKIKKGSCGGAMTKKKLCLNSREARNLRTLATNVGELASLVKEANQLYNAYTEYMLCKTCKLLGINYPANVIYLEQKRTNQAKEGRRMLETCPECETVCKNGKHLNDLIRASILRDNILQRPHDRIYIATVETIGRTRGGECFSCLARCLGKMEKRVIVL